ncbi:MAG TPA: ribonuclease P protein component [Xanthobacteraceae bacterium]|nr:ribonuclease P protein component [Xanthobacteraceae bacterium]
MIGTPVPSFPVERLKRRSDFQAAAAGLRASGSAFVVQARRRAVGGAVRIGFTVSKRVGNAVERNRVRRRLREIVRMSTSGGAGGLCPGHDYVLIGRRAALAAPFGEMMREFGVALGRIHAPGAGELVAPAATPYIKRVRHPGRKSSAATESSRKNRPLSRPKNPPNSRRTSFE